MGVANGTDGVSGEKKREVDERGIVRSRSQQERRVVYLLKNKVS